MIVLCVPIVSKLGHEWNPLFCHLARRNLIIRYFCLLFSDKNAHFLTKNHNVDYFWYLLFIVNWRFILFFSAFASRFSEWYTTSSFLIIIWADFQFLLLISLATPIINALLWPKDLNKFPTFALIFRLNNFWISSLVWYEYTEAKFSPFSR